MPDKPTEDLNAVITAAVNARVEAAVAGALASEGTIRDLVAKALTAPITVREDYKDRTTTFLKETIDKTIKSITAAAVERVVSEEREAIEHAVREAIRSDVKGIARALTASVVEAADKAYGINVQLKYRGRD